MLVRNRTAADQTDLGCFLLTTGSENVCFFESSSPVVRKGGAGETWHQLSLRTEPRTVNYIVVKCPSNETASQFEDTSSKSAEKFLCFVRKAAANMN